MQVPYQLNLTSFLIVILDNRIEKNSDVNRTVQTIVDETQSCNEMSKQ